MVALLLIKVKAPYTDKVPELFVDMDKLPELIARPLPDTIAMDTPDAVVSLPLPPAIVTPPLTCIAIT